MNSVDHTHCHNARVYKFNDFPKTSHMEHNIACLILSSLIHASLYNLFNNRNARERVLWSQNLVDGVNYIMHGHIKCEIGMYVHKHKGMIAGTHEIIKLLSVKIETALLHRISPNFG